MKKKGKRSKRSECRNKHIVIRTGGLVLKFVELILQHGSSGGFLVGNHPALFASSALASASRRLMRVCGRVCLCVC